jgi:hypothetical protein
MNRTACSIRKARRETENDQTKMTASPTLRQQQRPMMGKQHQQQQQQQQQHQQQQRRRFTATTIRPIQQSVFLLQLFLGILVVSISCFAVVVEAKAKACTNLPRIEAQFLCNRNVLKEGFNATEVFEDYYTNEVFVDKNKSSSSSSRNWHQPYQLQLYVSVSLNTAHDVSKREWYHQRCDASSNETLVSIDVRGYYDWEEENENNETETPPHHDDFSLFEKFSDYPQTSDLEAYLSSKVCGGRPLDFYRARIREWSDSSYPITGGSASTCSLPAQENEETSKISSRRGGGFVTYPSSSILNEDGSKVLLVNARQPRHDKVYYSHQYGNRVFLDGYTYDHDLSLLCGGAEDFLSFYGGDEDVLPSPFFYLVGVLFGYFMVYMIKAEFIRPLRYRQQLPMRYPSSTSTSSTTTIVDDSENDDDDNSDVNDGDNDNVGDDDNRRQEIELVMI